MIFVISLITVISTGKYLFVLKQNLITYNKIRTKTWHSYPEYVDFKKNPDTTSIFVVLTKKGEGNSLKVNVENRKYRLDRLSINHWMVKLHFTLLMNISKIVILKVTRNTHRL